MLVTPESNRRNRSRSLTFVGRNGSDIRDRGLVFPSDPSFVGPLPGHILAAPARCLRSLRIMSQPFPASWELILQSHVAFFRALSDAEKEHFRQLVKVFLDEVRITAIRTDVDDTVRVLIAASAVFPIFGFHDWEYPRLGEVLVYPESFGENYQTTGKADENTLGMVGLKHLSGVMILSKPSLLAGFDNTSNHDNVGVHEFAHLVENEEAEHGLPPEVPWRAVNQWVQYVRHELSHPQKNRSYINAYAYTNEHEFFAVLAEYFFKSPDLLQEKDPQLYAMLREMYHQDTRSLLQRLTGRKQSAIQMPGRIDK